MLSRAKLETVSPGWVLAKTKIAYFLFFPASLSEIVMNGISRPERDYPMDSNVIFGFSFKSYKYSFSIEYVYGGNVAN